GWTVEELAKKVGFSKRTIDRLEAGRPCYLFTVRQVSEQFGVPLAELLAASAPPPAEEEPRVKLVITVRDDFSDQIGANWYGDGLPAEPEDFMDTLRKILARAGGGSDIDIASVKLERSPGDFAISVTMTKKELVALLTLLPSVRSLLSLGGHGVGIL